MSPKSVQVIVAIGLLATGTEQPAWARLPQATPAPATAPKLGKAVDFQVNTRDHDGDNPYGVIVSQNVFHLVPEPPPAPPKASGEESAPPTLKLTGLVQVAGQQPRAMFVTVPKDPKDTAYYNLVEGEHQDNLELVKILPDQEAAEVVLSGTRMTILLKNSKPFVPQIQAPGSVPNPMGAPIPNPGDPVQMASSVIGAAPIAPGEGVITSGGAIPTRELRGASSESTHSVEEAHVLMAADAVAHSEVIAAGKYPPPIPPIQALLDSSGGENEGEAVVLPSLPVPGQKKPRTK